jgi:hypothetical protein
MDLLHSPVSGAIGFTFRVWEACRELSSGTTNLRLPWGRAEDEIILPQPSGCGQDFFALLEEPAYSGAKVDVSGGTPAKWLFRQEKATFQNFI